MYFFHAFIHVYSPRAGTDSPLGSKFLYQHESPWWTKSLVEGTWVKDVQSKSSLKYINPSKVKVGQSHPEWSMVRDSIYDSRRVQMKCLLLTSTYTFQSNRAVFNQHAVDATCKLCCSAPETCQQFLVECQALSDERRKYLSQVGVVTDRLDVDLYTLKL